MAMAMSMSTLPGVGSPLRLSPVTNIDATTLATEATRYLGAVDLFCSLELDVKWRSEANELGAPSLPPGLQRPPGCECCAGPLIRINGQHVCFRT